MPSIPVTPTPKPPTTITRPSGSFALPPQKMLDGAVISV